METYPIVPEGLEKELAKYNVDVIYDDGSGELKRVSYTPHDTDGRIWIELRPHLVVERSVRGPSSEDPWSTERTSIPFERVWVVDLSDETGEPSYPVYTPTRWVKGPSGVLQRITS